MKSKKELLLLFSILMGLIGCGGGASSEGESTTSISLPFSNKVINNRGLFVEGSVNGYGIKIYSDTIEGVNPQEIHKGIVVEVNGKVSEVIPIQISYLNKNIVVVLFNSQGEKVAVSSTVLITDVPVIVIKMIL